MRTAIKKKLNLIYFHFQIIGTARDIILHIFKTLPICLAEDALVKIEETESCLGKAKHAYEDISEILKILQKTNDSQDNALLNLNEKLDETLAPLIEHHNFLRKILEETLQSLSNSILRKHQAFFEQLDLVNKCWQKSFTFASELKQQVDQTIPTGAVIFAFEKLLQELVGQVKILWSELDKIRSAPNDLNVSETTMPKDVTKRCLILVDNIKTEKTILGDGAAWLLAKESLTSITLLKKILQPSCVESTLSQIAKLFENYTKHLLKQKKAKLKKAFGASYEDALQKQDDINFNRGWLNILMEHSETILSTKTRGIYFALQAKELLYSFKNRYYLDFYHNKNKKLRQARVIIELTQKLPLKEVLKKLNQQQIQIKEQVDKITTDLSDYGIFAGIVTFGIRLWTESYYFQWSKGFFSAADEITQQHFAKDTVLGTKLSPTSINVWSSVLSGGMFAADIYSSKWFGTSYTLVSSFSQVLLSDLELVMDGAENLAISREEVVNNISKIEWALGLCTMVVFGFLSGGSVIYLAGSHIVGTLLRMLTDHFFRNNEATPGNLFLKGLINRGGYIGGTLLWRTSYPKIHAFFKPPTPEQLLNDSKLCLEHKKLCQTAITKELGLNENATLAEVKIKYRELSKKYHPDVVKPTSNHIEFWRINRAKERAVEIISGKEKNTEFDESKNTQTEKSFSNS